MGLRLRIVFALTAAFVIAFVLLAIATVQLTHRARVADREHDSAATAALFLTSLGDEPTRAEFVRLADTTIGQGGVRGVELRFPAERRLRPWMRGVTELGSMVDSANDRHTVRLWIRPPAARTRGPFDQLLLLYFALTGGAILLLTYVALTVLVVRPVDRVTQASTRLARGNLEVTVPVEGAAEVARLAQSFNEMATQLKHDRATLEDRVAELERTSRELSSAEDQVLRSERLASVGRLSAGVAHEIGNPLAAILGLVELIRGGQLDKEEEDEFLGRIQAETERIHAIINGLLDFSRRGGDEEGNADLARVIEDAVRLVEPQEDFRNITIERRDLPRTAEVRGSADHLKQLMLNLLLNASDAVDGRGTITISLTQDNKKTWVLAVEDDGPGIPADVLEHLFEPFVTTKPTGKGTGLGLAVCHAIVERAGGEIVAANTEGGGARFEVRLRPS